MKLQFQTWRVQSPPALQSFLWPMPCTETHKYQWYPWAFCELGIVCLLAFLGTWISLQYSRFMNLWITIVKFQRMRRCWLKQNITVVLRAQLCNDDIILRPSCIGMATRPAVGCPKSPFAKFGWSHILGPKEPSRHLSFFKVKKIKSLLAPLFIVWWDVGSVLQTFPC